MEPTLEDFRIPGGRIAPALADFWTHPEGCPRRIPCSYRSICKRTRRSIPDFQVPGEVAPFSIGTGDWLYFAIIILMLGAAESLSLRDVPGDWGRAGGVCLLLWAGDDDWERLPEVLNHAGVTIEQTLRTLGVFQVGRELIVGDEGVVIDEVGITGGGGGGGQTLSDWSLLALEEESLSLVGSSTTYVTTERTASCVIGENILRVVGTNTSAGGVEESLHETFRDDFRSFLLLVHLLTVSVSSSSSSSPSSSSSSSSFSSLSMACIL